MAKLSITDVNCENKEVCKNGGICKKNKCHCQKPFWGSNCEKKSNPKKGTRKTNYRTFIRGEGIGLYFI